LWLSLSSKFEALHQFKVCLSNFVVKENDEKIL
jgi:hypothetical protein